MTASFRVTLVTCGALEDVGSLNNLGNGYIGMVRSVSVLHLERSGSLGLNVAFREVWLTQRLWHGFS